MEGQTTHYYDGTYLKPIYTTACMTFNNQLQRPHKTTSVQHIKGMHILH